MKLPNLINWYDTPNQLQFSLMQYHTLALYLFAAQCLAADKSSKLACKSAPAMSQSALDVRTNTCGLQYLIMKQHPEKIMHYLMSCKNFSKELAVTFAIGLALGKYTDMTILGTSRSGRASDIYVSPQLLRKTISANANCFEVLFDLKGVLKIPQLEIMGLSEFRAHFADNAVTAEAMIASDVAILQWLARAIHTQPKEVSPNDVSSDDMSEVGQIMLLPFCALSIDPLIGSFLVDDIKCVLEQVKHATRDKVQFAPLLTLIKLLDDDSPISPDLETIAAKVYPKRSNACAESRMILGPNHPFVLTMEKGASQETLDLCDIQIQEQHSCDRKLYSIGDGMSLNFDQNAMFLVTNNKPIHVLYATFDKDDYFSWDEKYSKVADKIYFERFSHSLLLIISMLRPPSTFCESVTSCTSLKDFQKLLQGSSIRRMILANGISILETSFLYNV